MTEKFFSTFGVNPINRLAASGLTSGSEHAPMINLHRKRINALALRYRYFSNKPLSICRDDVCKALGFDDFEHYKNVWRKLERVRP